MNTTDILTTEALINASTDPDAFGATVDDIRALPEGLPAEWQATADSIAALPTVLPCVEWRSGRSHERHAFATADEARAYAVTVRSLLGRRARIVLSGV